MKQDELFQVEDMPSGVAVFSLPRAPGDSPVAVFRHRTAAVEFMSGGGDQAALRAATLVQRRESDAAARLSVPTDAPDFEGTVEAIQSRFGREADSGDGETS